MSIRIDAPSSHDARDRNIRGRFHDGGAPQYWSARMVYLSPVEYRLLRHAQTPGADLSRDVLAEAAGVIPTSVGRVLTRLLDRDAIEIERGPNRRILKITPLFKWQRGTGYRVRNPRPQQGV